MNIALDYDETFTRDPVFWVRFIRLCKVSGHMVYCITLRNKANSQEVLDSIGGEIGGDNCIFTALKAKRKAAWDHGIRIDVWIDDMPIVVDQDY